jgi:hypothetical protein
MDYYIEGDRVSPTSVWNEKPFNSERGTESFMALGFDKEDFPRPKPIGLMTALFEHTTTGGDYILDYFLGSGTTICGLIELNANNSNVSGNLNVAGNINYTKTFGSFTSNATQTNSNVGNAIYMTLNNDEGSNGVSIVSSSQITVAKPGRYNIQFSAQADKTDSGTDQIEIWLTKNGTAVANSATQLVLSGNNDKHVAAWNWVDNATTANTYYQIAWASNDANVQLKAIASANTLSGVAIPSLIVTVVPVGA